jgi:hypothetical protein
MWASFRGAAGAVIGLLGTIGTFAAWFVDPTQKIGLPWFVALTTVSLILAVTLFEAARRALRHAARPLPAVRLAVREDTSGTIVLVLDGSPLFSTDLSVSVFAVEHEDYEAQIATGYVETVREDGRIQVRLVEIAVGRNEYIQNLLQNDMRILKKIKVKPYLSRRPISSGGDPT